MQSTKCQEYSQPQFPLRNQHHVGLVCNTTNCQEDSPLIPHFETNTMLDLVCNTTNCQEDSHLHPPLQNQHYVHGAACGRVKEEETRSMKSKHDSIHTVQQKFTMHKESAMPECVWKLKQALHISRNSESAYQCTKRERVQKPKQSDEIQQ